MEECHDTKSAARQILRMGMRPAHNAVMSLSAAPPVLPAPLPRLYRLQEPGYRL
jgi:hypothetical protein